MTLLQIVPVALLISCTSHSAVFAPQKRIVLQTAVSECIHMPPGGNCNSDSYGPIWAWNVSAITSMAFIFNGAKLFNQNLSPWDVSSVTNMDNMFAYAGYFDKSLSAWDVSSVTSMQYMFSFARSFNQDLSTWNVTTVTKMNAMFSFALSFNQNLSAWDVSAVTTMVAMFANTVSFHQTLCGAAWVNSKALQTIMFRGSPGSISSTVCTAIKPKTTDTVVTTTTATMLVTLATTTSEISDAISTTYSTFTLFAIAVLISIMIILSVFVVKPIRSRLKKRSGDLSPREIPLCAPNYLTRNDQSPIFRTQVSETTTSTTKLVETDVRIASAEATTSSTDPAQADASIASAEATTSSYKLTEADVSIASAEAITSIINLAEIDPSITSTFDLAKFVASITSTEAATSTDLADVDVSVPSAEANIFTTNIAETHISTSAPTERTFATSNYKRLYTPAVAAPMHYKLLGAMHNLLRLYAKRIHGKGKCCNEAALDLDIMAVVKKISRRVFAHGEDAEYGVDAMAEHLWTSSKKHRVVKGMELCWVLNAVIRDDVAEEIEAAAPIFRSINSRRVRRGKVAANIDAQSYPANGETWRGGGFRRQYRAFFERMVGQKYRVPGYLATSDNRQIAVAFAFEASTVHPSHPCAVWRITFDARGELNPKYRVKHMTFVSKTLTAGENEYLFAPYSVFTLVSVKWSADKETSPHLFTIHAALDNKEEDEYLPLAPWY